MLIYRIALRHIWKIIMHQFTGVVSSSEVIVLFHSGIILGLYVNSWAAQADKSDSSPVKSGHKDRTVIRPDKSVIV
jgi:hypothetical protein